MRNNYPLAAAAVLLLAFSLVSGCGKKEKPEQAAPQVQPKPVQIGLYSGLSFAPRHAFVSDLVITPAFGSNSSGTLWSSWAEAGYSTGLAFSALSAEMIWPWQAKNGVVSQRGSSHALQRGADGTPVQVNGSTFYLPDSTLRKQISAGLVGPIAKGLQSLIIQDPLFFAESGYSPAFRQLFRNFTGKAWLDPRDSAQVWFTTGRAKQKMITGFVRDLAGGIKRSAAQSGEAPRILLQMPSSIDAAANNWIVPGIAAARIDGLDGIIGEINQLVRARPVVYQGVRKYRPFAQAYLNASWWINAFSATDKELWLAFNPHSETLFKKMALALLLNPRATQLIPFVLPPGTGNLPERTKRLWGTFAYIFKALGQIPQSDVRWHGYSWPRTGIVFSDSYTWVRGAPWSCEMESFFELAFSLLYHGVPVEVVPLERLSNQKFIDQFGVLLMTYEGYKPPSPKQDKIIEKWLRSRGGLLIFYLGVTGPFDEVESWWSKNYDRPHEPLFDKLGIGLYPEAGLHKIGKGILYSELSSPKELAKRARSGEMIWNTFRNILNAMSPDSAIFETRPALILDRGPYRLVWVPDETSQASSFLVEGNWIEAFTEEFPLIFRKEIVPGQSELLVNLDYFPMDTTALVLSSAPINDFYADSTTVTFTSQWSLNTETATLLRLPAPPKELICRDSEGEFLAVNSEWQATKNLLRINYRSQGKSLQFRLLLK